MSDSIFFENLELEMCVGCSEEERKTLQTVVVDIYLDYSSRKAGSSDRLEDAVDYCELYDIIQSTAQSKAFHLLEHFCQQCAQNLLKTPMNKVKIRAYKAQCPIPNMKGRVGVEMIRTSDD